MSIPFLALLSVFMHTYGTDTSLTSDLRASVNLGANANIKYLWAIPLEEVRFFSPEDRSKALLPDWMRADLVIMATELYNDFLSSSNLTNLDKRDAESIVSAFRDYQMNIFSESNGLFNVSVLQKSLPSVNKSSRVRDAAVGVESFRMLLGKVAADFAAKMGFLGGTKFLYQARMWAEVLGPGDAVLPKNFADTGAVAAGILFAHIPNGTVGTPAVELLDPRGHNPPFGKDEVIPAAIGSGFMYPGWVNRMSRSHRCCEGDPKNFLDTHRIDWGFEIGLFQYPEKVLKKFYDLENCPFQNGFRRMDGQLFFELDVEELVKLDFSGALPDKAETGSLLPQS